MCREYFITVSCENQVKNKEKSKKIPFFERMKFSGCNLQKEKCIFMHKLSNKMNKLPFFYGENTKLFYFTFGIIVQAHEKRGIWGLAVDSAIHFE